MSLNGTQIFFGVLLALALLYTIYGYPKRYGALTGRSRLYRTAGMILLNLLTLLVFLFTVLDLKTGVSPPVARVRVLLYLVSCVLLVVTLMFIALLDSLEAVVVFRRERRGNAEQFLREEMERAAERRTQRQDKTESDPPRVGDG